MFIPIGVDVPFERRPFVNWLVVFACVIVFCLMIAAAVQGESELIKDYVLEGYSFKGLFGHMWLHGGLFHLIGNMLFLWIFGNAVCSKIGNLMYFPVYILLGLFAAVAYNIFSDGRAVGASGAINGIVGMFLIFYPLNDITYFWMLYLRWSGTVSFSSFWAIIMWFVFDIYGAVNGGVGVAYTAHIGGFLAGVAIAVALLKFKIVEMEDDERSLLQILSGDKERQSKEDMLWEMSHNNSPLHRELYEAENEYKTSHERKQESVRFAYQQGNYEDEVEARAAQQASEYEPAPETIEPSPIDDGYIRFPCECGKRLKVPSSYAGKNGKCPRCAKRVRVPGGDPN